MTAIFMAQQDTESERVIQDHALRRVTKNDGAGTGGDSQSRSPAWNACDNVVCVRVLIDYRPALRDRSGVGEYAHQLAKALLVAYPPSPTNGALDLTIFSSSWKDRLEVTPDLRGAATIDRRAPVR